MKTLFGRQDCILFLAISTTVSFAGPPYLIPKRPLKQKSTSSLASPYQNG